MRITMVLPCSGRYPIGGFRIFYEYANRLSKIGHKVHIVHFAIFPEFSSLKRKIHAIGQFARDKITGGYLPKSWFKLDPAVETSFFYSPQMAVFPNADIIIASAWHTAEVVASLPESCGKKAYFIQSLEDWSGDRDRVLATWQLPMTLFVVAKWLGDIAKQMGREAIYLPNAIDQNFFKIQQPIESRDNFSILFCSHPTPLKGSADIVKALNGLRDQGFSLKIACFGRISPEKWGLKKPFAFEFDPPQSRLRDLYNQNAIFISASHTEGWGLLPAEASSCGTAPIVSRNGGHCDFLTDEDTALMFEPHDTAGLEYQIKKLILNAKERISLAHRSHQNIQNYNWHDATHRLEAAIQQIKN